MSQYTLEGLVDKLKNDVIGRWHKEGRVGNDGSAGNTLEDLYVSAKAVSAIVPMVEAKLKEKNA
jgi:hypothetical protein